MSNTKPVAFVAGALAAKVGNGGHAWSRISLVLGLQRLGFDVVYVEQLPSAGPAERAYFDRVCVQFGIDGCLLLGAPTRDLVERAETASLLLNIGGHLTVEPLKRSPRRRVYLDDDPGYTQLWTQARVVGARLQGHDMYFTFGQNIGGRDCTLPTGGLEWHRLRPPVLLDEWPFVHGALDRFTTVASWRGAYGRVEWGGRLLGQKAHEFRRFVDVPELVDHPFEIALAIDEADHADADLLKRHGWQLVDPRGVAATPDDFRRYVQGSGAEFSVAQGIYVETASGWFSDRTTRYLASGKPAVVQDTGFARHVPTGEGLIAFSTLDEAVAGAEAIARDYSSHAQAARALAEQQFGSDKVLGRMLDEVGV